MYMKTHLDGVIDISPMGCRTGFYLSIWGDVESDTIQQALIKSLGQILETKWEDVPGTTAKECGNFRDHSLFSAKEYAAQVLEGFKKS
jgi:S-ribosylhomocysteine lyase